MSAPLAARTEPARARGDTFDVVERPSPRGRPAVDGPPTLRCWATLAIAARCRVRLQTEELVQILGATPAEVDAYLRTIRAYCDARQLPDLSSLAPPARLSGTDSDLAAVAGRTWPLPSEEDLARAVAERAVPDRAPAPPADRWVLRRVGEVAFRFLRCCGAFLQFLLWLPLAMLGHGLAWVGEVHVALWALLRPSDLLYRWVVESGPLPRLSQRVNAAARRAGACASRVVKTVVWTCHHPTAAARACAAWGHAAVPAAKARATPYWRRYGFYSVAFTVVWLVALATERTTAGCGARPWTAAAERAHAVALEVITENTVVRSVLIVAACGSAYLACLVAWRRFRPRDSSVPLWDRVERPFTLLASWYEATVGSVVGAGLALALLAAANVVRGTSPAMHAPRGFWAAAVFAVALTLYSAYLVEQMGGEFRRYARSDYGHSLSRGATLLVIVGAAFAAALTGSVGFRQGNRQGNASAAQTTAQPCST